MLKQHLCNHIAYVNIISVGIIIRHLILTSYFITALHENISRGWNCSSYWYTVHCLIFVSAF